MFHFRSVKNKTATSSFAFEEVGRGLTKARRESGWDPWSAEISLKAFEAGALKGKLR
jgi:hypothetical protein